MKRSRERELMDLPGQPPALLEEDLRNLRVINRCLGGYRSALRGVERALGAQQQGRFSLLDVGTGSADIPVSIILWARRRNVAARIVGLEAESTTAGLASARTQRVAEVSVVRADAMAPPFPPASFDFVLASQLLHHFSEAEIVGSLQTWARIARRAIIVSDLIRHPLAYHAIRIATRLATRNVMTRTDAPLSVKRAFTLPEWRALFHRAGVGPVEIFSVLPFRMMGLVFVKGTR